jgi:hypothetical protein
VYCNTEVITICKGRHLHLAHNLLIILLEQFVNGKELTAAAILKIIFRFLTGLEKTAQIRCGASTLPFAGKPGRKNTEVNTDGL